MSSNSIALSQEELDRLFSKEPETSPTEEIKPEKKIDPRNIFLDEKQVESVKTKLSERIEDFREKICSIYSDTKNRKIFVTTIDQISLLDFYTSSQDHDFLFSMLFDGFPSLIKLDSHLFSALAKVDFDKRRETNLFQSEALKKLVVEHLAASMIKGKEENIGSKVESLVTLSQENFIENSAGLLVSINWNEDFRSYGVEKLFIPKKTYNFLTEKDIF